MTFQAKPKPAAKIEINDPDLAAKRLQLAKLLPELTDELLVKNAIEIALYECGIRRPG